MTTSENLRMLLHPLPDGVAVPAEFNNPFSYEPHPLCLMAAQEVQTYLAAHEQLLADADKGKMFGVLVVERNAAGRDAEAEPRLGYLAAYSGLLGGRNDWAWFVPPVFDAQRPDGYFKTHEAEISRMNHRIEMLEAQLNALLNSDGYKQMKQRTAQLMEQQRQRTNAAKALRDMRRLQHNLSPEDDAQLVRESQFMKAELRRTKARCEEMAAQWEAQIDAINKEAEQLRRQRHQASDDLQRWLFAQYRLLNATGQERSLLDIFARFKHDDSALPPAGSGDCCAPKLLQFAYQNALRPVCMAEFWWGESPRAEVRHHLNFYPACRGKCLPILTWMLQGCPTAAESAAHVGQLDVIYEDDWLAVVNKPAGMLSVPGKIRRPSVEEIMRQRWRDDVNPLIVHRLDMETSGLMVVARTKWAHEMLQRAFAEGGVEKTYIALLEGRLAADASTKGRISLPLRPDLDDRPRQLVDHEHGRQAVTDYEVLGHDGGMTRLSLHPLTGRTHQLRMHCAHSEGLAMPIRGDELYGHKADRLYLHAQTLAFVHPKTGQRIAFSQPAPF